MLGRAVVSTKVGKPAPGLDGMELKPAHEFPYTVPKGADNKSAPILRCENMIRIDGIAILNERPTSPVLVGGEARYLRQYDGFGLDMFAGQGFFIGPTIYFKLSEKAWIAAAWSAQVAGQATTVAGSLDLVNFERRQARLQFGVNF